VADPWKVLVFRKDGVCDSCGASLPVGAEGLWNSTTWKVRCLEHGVSAQPQDIAEEAEEAEPNRGTAGRSAKDKYNELHAIEEEHIRNRFGRFKKLGEMAVILHSDSQKTENWKVGSFGEKVVGARLDQLGQEVNFEVLHDRRRPPTKANIDHIVVTPAGVFVVDTKYYEGKIEVRQPGWFSGDPAQLFINGRNRTKIVDGVKKQVVQVESVLKNSKSQMPVFGVLTFVVGPLHVFILQEKISSVFLSTQRGVEKILRRRGHYTIEDIKATAELLALKFPEA
jgi:hypothetical protein